jgi:hypothetical protein
MIGHDQTSDRPIDGDSEGATAEATATTLAEPSSVEESSWLTIVTASGDTTGATDTSAINDALAAAPAGGLVQLGPGSFYTDAPIVVPSGVLLAGIKGGVNGGSAERPTGSVLTPVSSFTQGSTAQALGVIVVQEPSASGEALGCEIRDLAILGSDLPSGSLFVDGIAGYGAVCGLRLSGLSIAKVTGRGIAYYANSHGDIADGLWADRIMLQRTGGNAFDRIPSDASISNVHIQYAGTAQGDGGHGFITAGGNVSFLGCRSDLNAGCGWQLKHSGGGDGYTDSTRLVGCATERNQQHGVWVANPSSAGTRWCDPVIISGCHFGEDGSGGGAGGDYAGIYISGFQSSVIVDGTSVDVGTIDYSGGCPKYGIMTAAEGSDDGVPRCITVTGATLNYSAVAGGCAINDAAPASFFCAGPEVMSSAGYDPDPRKTSVINRRQGTATLSGGTVTVSNAWVTASSRILLTNIGGSGTVGALYVSALSAGSLTIQSTSSSDTSRVLWAIMDVASGSQG